MRALTFWVLIAMPSLWVLAGAIFIESVVFEPINPLTMMVEQERIPTGMRGRVIGVRTALGFGTLPVGVLVYGYLLEGIGLRDTLIAMAIVNAVLPLAMLAMPTLRSMNGPHPGAVASLLSPAGARGRTNGDEAPPLPCAREGAGR